MLMVATTLAFLLINPSFSENLLAGEPPTFRNGTLTIPRVDTNTQLGQFQDVEFQLDPATNTWQLINYREARIITEQGITLDSVEPIITDSSPVQVLLLVKGRFSDGCGKFGQINQQLNTHQFEIIIHRAPPLPNVSCIAAEVPFEKIIPLEVYGLSAGIYEYSVNGTHTGSFTLSKDNTFTL